MIEAATAVHPTRQEASATADSCAKINLTLEVLFRRGDGYHEVRSLIVGVGLRDSIRCTLRPEPGLVLECKDPVPSGSDNLAHRAAMKLARHCGLEPALEIGLKKRIPVGAGLGGGSGDAATTLRLCNSLWQAGLGRAELSRLGARIGSDMPFFFALPSAVVTGRGEKVEPVKLRWSGWVLLVFAGPGVSTAEVYRAWRSSDAAGLPGGMERAICEVTRAEELSGLLGNHLEQAVFRVSPAVARAYHELNRSGFGPMRVSGAGSALYRLFDDEGAAGRAAGEIENLGVGVTTAVVRAPIGESPVVCKEN